MGTDLYGIKPTKPVGRHFRRSVGRWSSLVELGYGVASWQASRCPSWYAIHPGSRGLNKKNAIKLALRLEYQLLMGRVTAFMDKHSGESSGYRESCEESDVEEFIAFLKACGGFEIH